MMAEQPPTLGQVAYEAFVATRFGQKPPAWPWERFDPEDKDAWQVAASAAVDHWRGNPPTLPPVLQGARLTTAATAHELVEYRGFQLYRLNNPDGWCIADDGGWCAGVYPSEQAAKDQCDRWKPAERVSDGA